MTLLLITAAVLTPHPANTNQHRGHVDVNTRWCVPSGCLSRGERHRYRVAIRGYRPWLRRVRACESGGNYAIDTGNGFRGAYQWTMSTWRAVGGRGYPNDAAPLEQDFRAVKTLHLQGRGAWPVCG